MVMGPVRADNKLLAWGIENIEPGTLRQAAMAARLPFVLGVSLMPDAHRGIGATIGSVIPTEGAIVPSFAGVDLGCGMIATLTDLTAADLPDDLGPLMPLIAKRIPAGVGKGHDMGRVNAADTSRLGQLGHPRTELTGKQDATLVAQFGTLGSGNHFVEVCLDEDDRVWHVLHSGSRGIGNQLASQHIKAARGVMKRMFITLEDPDLAYFAQGTPEFDHYIADMLWAQRYAMGSRQVMADALSRSLFEVVGHGRVVDVINCHHNFTQREHHMGRDLWITRKGAIKAGVGDRGVIPGSMGARSYIVEGLGNPASFTSCSHGAGRTMSRSQAKRDLTPDSLREAMGDRVWNGDATALLDEHPLAYKPIEEVMAAQADLVKPLHELHQIFNYKGF
jgi:tRNA-splicing ligase RtcB (3'-phosphate/5'-hydroxy nucleic acid ligase)